MSGGLLFDNLQVTFRLPGGQNIKAVDGVTLPVLKGQVTGLIGESGCGKSVLGMALLGLLPPYAAVEGTISLDGETLTPQSARAKLGREIGLIPQNPADSLNPGRTVGAHLREALLPLKLGRAAAKEKGLALLTAFGFAQPERIWKAYPHELSGGMQQRVLCAVGAACSPQWMLADEPTKGLDKHLLGQVLDTLKTLPEQGVESMLVITHDLELARALCHHVAVMYAGQVLEWGENVLSQPLHPYTCAFLDALPENGFQPMDGVAPRAGERLPGCPFAPRCPHCMSRCERERPPETQPQPGRRVRCFLYAE